MYKTVNFKSATLVCADSLQYIKTISDNSVDLIATDPPYFRVKTESWDNQWSSNADFLAWLDEFLAEFWRILKPNGSLYMFTGSKLSADIELLTRDRFNVLNNITWTKPSGIWNKQRKENLRTYFPATEKIIFAEHYGSEGYAKGGSGYASKCAELQRNVFAPIIDKFASARQQLNISAAEINAVTGKQMCSHWFSYSQWRLPRQDDFEKLQSLFRRKAAEQGVPCPPPFDEAYEFQATAYDASRHEYDALKSQYDELRLEYEHLRRPFTLTKDVPYTDVWEFASVQYYPGKHPCEKPAALMEHIIRSSSRPGDVVADFFMGSGSTIKAALTLGRQAIGVELEEERFEQTVSEISAISG
jgi:site-specific DNA-methyltransferase (adenine-specific)